MPATGIVISAGTAGEGVMTAAGEGLMTAAGEGLMTAAAGTTASTWSMLGSVNRNAVAFLCEGD
jgi:hypothetical protein